MESKTFCKYPNAQVVNNGSVYNLLGINWGRNEVIIWKGKGASLIVPAHECQLLLTPLDKISDEVDIYVA